MDVVPVTTLAIKGHRYRAGGGVPSRQNNLARRVDKNK